MVGASRPFGAAPVLAALACWLFAGAVGALSTDKDQPIEVEADSAEMDDIRNVSIYRGNVIVTQGSIRITGDVMTVYNTEDDDLDYMVVEGRPATYRQLPDNSEKYDEAEALRMEYYELKNLVVLINNAVTIQKGNRLSGDRIEYDTELSQVRAWSAPQKGTAGGGAAETGDRVKLIIKKKEKPEEGTNDDPE